MGEVQISSQLATDLVSKISECLSTNKLKEAVEAINDNRYSACLKDNSWDLIPVIVKCLNYETSISSSELFECCESLLQVIAEKSNPEEALFEFIEQVELAKEDTKFFAVLKALQRILIKLITKRGRSLEWSLNTIQAYVKELPLPGDYYLEDDEKELLDADDAVQRITLFYTELLPFYKPFIDEVSLVSHPVVQIRNPPAEQKQRRDLLASFLLKLLEKPLACLDLESGALKSRARICAEKIMNYLSELVSDSFLFLEYVVDRQNSSKRGQRKNGTSNSVLHNQNEEEVLDIFASEDKTPFLSLGVFYYLLLAENIQIVPPPRVYSPLYVFQSAFYLAADLLRHSEQFVTRKGLLLAHALICGNFLTNFPHQILDSTSHSEFCKNLTNIVIYSDLKQYRELGIKIFKTYLFKFDPKGRYLLVKNLMNTIQHVNTRGYIISQYKDMIRQVFSENENNISEFFSGQKLFCILDLFCFLPEGKETDLMELGNQVITTLNLLIFLVIRDKYNSTGIRNHFKNLEESFFKPLREGLIISKAHYELKIKELKQEHHGEGDFNMSVTAGGQALPEMSFHDKMAVLDSALNSFAALEMLLARLEELIAERVESCS